jgi:hypothetical protein
MELRWLLSPVFLQASPERHVHAHFDVAVLFQIRQTGQAGPSGCQQALMHTL